MYKVCEKCGFMYEDVGNGCPQCGKSAETVNQENPILTNMGYGNSQSMGSFSTSRSSMSSSRSNSGGIDKKKIFIIAAAVCALGVVAVACAILLPSIFGEMNKADLDSVPTDSVQVNDSKENVTKNDYENLSEGYMPSCIDWSIQQVQDYFDSENCNVKFEYVYNSSVPANHVISQSVEPGSKLTPGCTIVLEMSKGEDNCPFEYQQKIVVTGSSNSSNASMELFVWENGEWVSKYNCFATVGKNGIGYDYGEGKGVTPEGIFKLGVVLSKNTISNTTWPNEIVSEDTCIVDDVSSSYYNTIANISALPDGVGYDDIGNTIISGNSDKVMYIEHNGNGISSDGVVPGNGSAITICGKTSDLYSTAGCVDISAGDFNTILTMLDYSMNPHIEITVQ